MTEHQLSDQPRPCIFCGAADPVRRSHIIPENLYRHAYDEKHRLIVVNAGLDELDLRQLGHYEPLLCTTCEGYFNDHFEKPCLAFFDALPEQIPPSGQVILPQCPALPLLLLSILFRASHARHEYWRYGKVGPSHLERMRDCLRNRVWDPRYSIWITGIIDDQKNFIKALVSNILTVRVLGHDLFFFCASGLDFSIKVSSHAIRKVTPSVDCMKPITLDCRYVGLTASTAGLVPEGQRGREARIPSMSRMALPWSRRQIAPGRYS